jgi:hypothetical protein
MDLAFAKSGTVAGFEEKIRLQKTQAQISYKQAKDGLRTKARQFRNPE